MGGTVEFYAYYLTVAQKAITIVHWERFSCHLQHFQFQITRGLQVPRLEQHNALTNRIYGAMPQ